MKGVQAVVIVLVVFSALWLYFLHESKPKLFRPDTDTNENNMIFTKMSMESRRTFVAKRCQEVKSWRNMKDHGDPLATVFIHHWYKLSVCSNLKVGSSTIANILYSLRNSTKHPISQKVYRTEVLRHDLPTRIINLLPYRSAMFVREPLERLYSAYGAGFGVRKENNTKVSFESFLDDVLKVDNVSLINPHHMPYYYRCRPCDVTYDVIGTVETFDEDLRSFLHSRMIDRELIPKRNAKNTTTSKLTTVLGSVPLKLRKSIWKKYHVDYYMFGYPKPF